eukprot:262738-Prorocentrum_minimum.AAC.3
MQGCPQGPNKWGTRVLSKGMIWWGLRGGGGGSAPRGSSSPACHTPSICRHLSFVLRLPAGVRLHISGSPSPSPTSAMDGETMPKGWRDCAKGMKRPW